MQLYSHKVESKLKTTIMARVRLRSRRKRLMTGRADERILKLTAKIVSAHVGGNQGVAHNLPALIRSVHNCIKALGGEASARSEPAVPIRKSVFPDYIVCLEDGQKLKLLKRHLQARYGLTPEDYRAKWGLPGNYPMVAPNHASQRSSSAKRPRLGQQSKQVPHAAEEECIQLDVSAEPIVTYGRTRRARGSRG